jgi:hypothetical protein
MDHLDFFLVDAALTNIKRPIDSGHSISTSYKVHLNDGISIPNQGMKRHTRRNFIKFTDDENHGVF